MRDYQPRERPLIPAGHDTWLAVSRVKRPSITKAENPTVDEQIEWLLRAITAPGADCAQRHDDLIHLAELIIKARGNKVPIGHGYTWDGDSNFGYGVTPIDSDTHDPDCIVCGDAEIYDMYGHEADFDRHPYQTRDHPRCLTCHQPIGKFGPDDEPVWPEWQHVDPDFSHPAKAPHGLALTEEAP